MGLTPEHEGTMTMIRRDIRAALALLALLLLGACQEDAPLTPGTPPLVQPDKYAAYLTGTCDHELHNALQEMWENDDGIVWCIIEGTISRVDGGSVSGTPAGWPEGYQVRIDVPPGAIPDTYPDNVLFGIVVPQSCLNVDPAVGRSSVPYRFFPDGIQFNPGYAATVTVCWPTWAGTPPTNGYQLVHLGTEVHEDVTHFRAIETRHAFPLATTLGLDPALKAADTTAWSVGISAAVEHFSRWEVADGDDPTGGGFLEATGVQSGDGCWTDNPPDPGDPLDPKPLVR